MPSFSKQNFTSNTNIGSADKQLGNSVSYNLSGTVMAVGALGGTGGEVRIYNYDDDDGVWNLSVTYTVSSAIEFGYSVALNETGDVCVIGAPGDSSDTGKIYVTTYNGSNWTSSVDDMEYYVGQTSGDKFGSSLTVTGNSSAAYIFVGAPNRASNDGGVYRFKAVISPKMVITAFSDDSRSTAISSGSTIGEDIIYLTFTSNVLVEPTTFTITDITVNTGTLSNFSNPSLGIYYAQYDFPSSTTVNIDVLANTFKDYGEVNDNIVSSTFSVTLGVVS